MSISTLLLSRNEEENLPRCLDSLQWCDDIVVLDSFSTDRTVEIARAAGARVLQRDFDDFARQRNFGLCEGDLAHDWVLHLDADEVVTDALREEMVQAVQNGSEQAYRIPSKMIFRGVWLKHAGLYPSYQVRLGKRDLLRFEQVGHGQRETLDPDDIGTLRSPLIHHSFSKGLEDWFERHNRYSTAEARHALASNRESRSVRRIFIDSVERRRWQRDLLRRLPLSPTLRFLYMYVGRLGFLDGPAGFTYCRLIAMYEYMTVLKIRELRGEGGVGGETIP